MSGLVTGIRTQNGVSKIDYNALENKPQEKYSTLEKEKLAGIDEGATNTTIVDGLTSTSTTSALSAKQGKVLNDKIETKQATVIGAATTIVVNDLTTNRALISDSSGKIAVSAVTSTELGYLDGVTSKIQSQLDAKAASAHEQSAITITSGTLDSARLPTVPMTKGGTNATTGKAGLKNLFAAGATILSSYQFGDELPTDDYTNGRIFFKKV